MVVPLARAADKLNLCDYSVLLTKLLCCWLNLELNLLTGHLFPLWGPWLVRQTRSKNGCDAEDILSKFIQKAISKTKSSQSKRNQKAKIDSLQIGVMAHMVSCCRRSSVTDRICLQRTIFFLAVHVANLRCLLSGRSCDTGQQKSSTFMFWSRRDTLDDHCPNHRSVSW